MIATLCWHLHSRCVTGCRKPAHLAGWRRPAPPPRWYPRRPQHALRSGAHPVSKHSQNVPCLLAWCCCKTWCVSVWLCHAAVISCIAPHLTLHAYRMTRVSLPPCGERSTIRSRSTTGRWRQYRSSTGGTTHLCQRPRYCPIPFHKLPSSCWAVTCHNFLHRGLFVANISRSVALCMLSTDCTFVVLFFRFD